MRELKDIMKQIEQSGGHVAEVGDDGFRAILCSLNHHRVFSLIVSNGMGWDHVSLASTDRCPTWDEMCTLKDLCFREEEVAVQIHPAKKDHVNCHPFCLHLWRYQLADFPLPPLPCL